jgi:arabinogalactan oligomer/maltooligosaccharide transport system permease protein
MTWKGSRKGLTILFFLLPTLLGILVFNVYPIVLNTYISFTNRNRFRPKPDCESGLSGVLDPLCWPQFRENAAGGLGSPYRVIEPLFDNYSRLLGELFAPDALLALGKIVLVFVPLVFVGVANRRMDRMIDRPISSFGVWVIGVLAMVLIAIIFPLGESFARVLDTGPFLAVVFRTALFVAIRVPLTFLFGLVLALILNNPKLPGKTFFRVALFVPWGASSVAILMALVWQFLFRQQGTINQLLSVLGVQGPIWLQNPVSAFAVVVIADLWFSYPFFMVAILGALQSIPGELYEAAEVDGANWWVQLQNITLPLIRPAVLPATVLTSITAFQMFGTAYAITAGGPLAGADTPGATEFVMVYAYRQIYQLQNFGRATAFAVLIFIMLFLATLYSLRITRITKGAYE